MLLHSQLWMDSRQVWTDSGQTWMDSEQTYTCVNNTPWQVWNHSFNLSNSLKPKNKINTEVIHRNLNLNQTYNSTNCIKKVERKTRLLTSLHLELSNSFLIGRRRTVNFRNQRLWCRNCRLYNNHVKDAQGHGKSCLVWLQCLIS